jgi:hypothetical protein
MKRYLSETVFGLVSPVPSSSSRVPRVGDPMMPRTIQGMTKHEASLKAEGDPDPGGEGRLLHKPGNFWWSGGEGCCQGFGPGTEGPSGG